MSEAKKNIADNDQTVDNGQTVNPSSPKTEAPDPFDLESKAETRKAAAHTPGLRSESLPHSAACMNPSPTVIKS